MARLLVNPGSPAAWEIQLKPGPNSLGRAAANDFQINDPSVSGSHCQLIVDSGRVVIRDLGSTNGTFVNRAPVKEAVLQSGQSVHLGGVEMAYMSDAPVPVMRISGTPPPATAAPGAPRLASPMVARVSTATAAPAVAVEAAPSETAPAAITGIFHCKFHPKSLARYYCPQCKRYFCEFCITSRTVAGVMHKTCRQCAVELATVEAPTDPTAGQKNFFSMLPGVFAYPFKGAGPFVIIVSMIVIAALDFISGGAGIFTKAAFYGYLFAFMQNIIHSTASEDEELPGWPAWDDIGGCFVRFAGCVLISFGPAIGLYWYAMENEEAVNGVAMISAMIFGCLYFPMALLAVAMKDSALAANPLVVLPAIVKAPLEYLVTVIILAAILGIRRLGDVGLTTLFPKGLTTHSMATLFEMFGARILWHFLGLYLLTVNMRVLGFLYVAKKRSLGWFNR